MPWNNWSCSYLVCFRKHHVHPVVLRMGYHRNPRPISHHTVLLSIYTYLDSRWVRYASSWSQSVFGKRTLKQLPCNPDLSHHIHWSCAFNVEQLIIWSWVIQHSLCYTPSTVVHAQLSIIMGGWHSSETALWCMMNSRSWLRHFVVCAYILQLYSVLQLQIWMYVHKRHVLLLATAIRRGELALSISVVLPFVEQMVIGRSRRLSRGLGNRPSELILIIITLYSSVCR